MLARLDAEAFPGQTLRYEANLKRIDEQGAATSGTILRLDHADAGPDGSTAWEPFGRVDLLFSHLDRNLAGIEFPEENFVFSENFRTILSAAGMTL